MHFDLDARERVEGVSEGPRRVRERAGIDHDRGGTPSRAVDGLDEVAFEVRLHVADTEAGFSRQFTEARHVLSQSGRPVHLRIARSEQVEIRSRYQQDFVAHSSPRNFSNTSLTNCGSTPRTVSTPSAPASTKVKSWCAFLSWDMASSSSDDARCSGTRLWSPNTSSTSSWRATSLWSTRPNASAKRTAKASPIATASP